MKRNIVVLQEEISDCGVCCLLSIIKYYKGMANLEELRIETNTTTNGVNAYNLINASRKYGFNAKGIKVTSLDNITLPVIAHIKLNNNLLHFIVIYEIKDKYFLVMDPAKGLIKITPDYFYSHFTGVIITLYPNGNIINYHPTNTIKNEYISFIKKNKTKLIVLIVIAIINLLLNVISSYYIELRIRYSYLFLSILFIIFEISKSLTNYIIEYNSQRLENKMSYDIQKIFLNFFIKLPLNYIHLKKDGELLSRFEELEAVKDFLNKLIINISLSFISFIFLLFMLIFYNVYLLIPIIVYVVLSLILNINYGKRLIPYVKDNIETNSNYRSDLVDMINGLTSIHHNTCYNYFQDAIKNSYKVYLNSNLNLTKYTNKMKELLSILSGTLIIIINTILIKCLDNYISIIIINYLIMYLLRYYESIVSLIPIYYYIKSYLRKCNDLLDIDFQDHSSAEYISGDIIIRNLMFSYDQINKTLNNINITIHANEKVIFKGPSGSGKSTICKLLTKELTTYEGNIFIGGQEVKNINVNELTANIYYSSQEEHIFTDTIKNNITLGNKVNELEFNRVVDICELEPIIAKRIFSYDTYLTGGGNELSGGERARIFVARALLSNKSILIFDESLAEVNSDLELRIVNKIFKLYQDKTIIYITHKNLNYPGVLVNI